jgi:hypothetical protein
MTGMEVGEALANGFAIPSRNATRLRPAEKSGAKCRWCAGIGRSVWNALKHGLYAREAIQERRRSAQLAKFSLI